MGVNALRCPLSFCLRVVYKCWWKKLAGITDGFTFKGLELPNGTKLKMLNRKTEDWYGARIENGMIVDENGRSHKTFSGLAEAYTGSKWNGWAYWLAKRPRDGVLTPVSWLIVGRTAKEDLES